MKKGFIQIPLLIAIVVSVVLASVVFTEGVLISQGKLKLANNTEPVKQEPFPLDISPTPEATGAATSSTGIVKAVENFRTQTFSLYRDNIEFLKQKIGKLELYKDVFSIVNDNDKDMLSFLKQLKIDGYEPGNALQITTLELAESTKILNAEQDLINQVYKTKLRLEEDLSILNSSNLVISKAEYLLRKDEVEMLVNESEIDNALAKIDSSAYFTGARRKEFEDKFVVIAEADKAQADQDLASLRVQAEAMIRNIPAVVYIPKYVPTDPLAITCNSSHDQYGNLITGCSSGSLGDGSIFFGKSISCKTSYDQYGNLTTSCGSVF